MSNHVRRLARPEGNIVTDDQLNEGFDADEAPVHTEEPPQYGVGPFSIREVALVGVWLVAFVISFFSISEGRFDSVWTSGLLWILTIGVPSAAVFLVVLRRLSPQGIRRVGSLGIDQFASVAFSVAAILWLQLVWETVAFVIDTGQWARTWVIWVELVLMLAGVALTVFAPVIPPFEQDFRGRPDVTAHRNARPIRPVSARPAPAPRAEEPEAVTAAPSPYASAEPTTSTPTGDATSTDDGTSTAAWEPAQTRDTFEPVAEPTTAVEQINGQPARQQAFWALVPEERDVVDEIGIPVFRIGPTAWALVIEDRGDTFVVRHEDGRIGFLHDVSDVTRG